MNSKNIIIAAVIALILIAGGVFVLGQKSPQPSVVEPEVTSREIVDEIESGESEIENEMKKM